MDYFSFCFNTLCLTGQGILHLSFSGRLTGKRQRFWYFAVYISLLFLLQWIANTIPLPGIAAIGAEVCLLYGINRWILGNAPSASWVVAILANDISQLSFGLVNSLEAVCFPHALGSPLLYPLVIVAMVVSLAICAGCYAVVVKSISSEELEKGANVGYLLFPVLFFFTAELYILQTAYSQVFYKNDSLLVWLEDVRRHTGLLALQALGLAGLLSTLYAYRGLCRSLQEQAAMRSLTQAVQAQKVYIAEAQARYEQTKAFRHDIKNHLSVLGGLLNSGKLSEGKTYLQKLETASEVLSFPYQTGNPVADILLGEKLGLAKAKGIGTEVSLVLPRLGGLDDFDLCVIFANALDNAICACQSLEGEASICVRGEQQGDFYMLAFENTCSEAPLPPEGTGLSNIRSVAEKYHGAMLAEKRGRWFSLYVLLNISLQPEGISFQKP